MAITEPTKIKLEFKEAVYMYGGDYNQGFEDGKSEGLEEGKAEGYNEGVEFGKANAPKEERTVTYKANGSYEVIPSSSELSMSKVNVNVEIPDDGSYSEGYNDGKNDGDAIGYSRGYAEGEAYGKANAPAENLSVTLKANGSYSYPKPSDKYHADVNVIVAVPSDSTPTQEKTKTITKNGTEVISPDEGFALEKVTVITDIPERLPTQTKTIDIEENGTEEVTADSGYALEKVIINTDIDTRLPEQEKSLEVTENKVYEVTPDDGYALAKVTVTGNVDSSSGGGSGGDDQLIKITTVSSMAGIFNSGLGYLIKSIDWTNFNKLQLTSFASFFKGFVASTIDLANLDTSYATDMSSMFYSCSAGTLNVKNFKTSKVTTMNSMFSSSEVSSLDLSGWNTSSLKNMQQMFNYCRYCHTMNFDGWDTSSVTSIGGAFYNASTLNNVTFGNNWLSNVKVTSFEMSACPLTKDSILDLANKIADKSDTSVYTGTQTVKLKSSQKSLFTEDELTALAGQFNAKNWTLSWS